MSDSECALIMRNILRGVELMHSQNTIHRDLKPENILVSDVNDPSSIKIADFGLSHRFSNTSKILNERCGTCIFMAPELLFKGSNYSKPVDLYSCGVIMYMLFSRGVHPFGDNVSREVYIKNINTEWAQPSNMSL